MIEGGQEEGAETTLLWRDRVQPFFLQQPREQFLRQILRRASDVRPAAVPSKQRRPRRSPPPPRSKHASQGQRQIPIPPSTAASCREPKSPSVIASCRSLDGAGWARSIGRMT